jgi:hypothetical protein
MPHLELKSVPKSTIMLDLVPVYDEEMDQRVAPDNLSQTRKSKRPDRSTRICSKRPHILGQFLIKSAQLDFLNTYEQERNERVGESDHPLEAESPKPPPGFHPAHLCQFYRSRGVSRQPTPGIFLERHIVFPISK